MDARTDMFQSVQDVSMLLMARQPVASCEAQGGTVWSSAAVCVYKCFLVHVCPFMPEFPRGFVQTFFVPAHSLLSATRKHLQ